MARALGAGSQTVNAPGRPGRCGHRLSQGGFSSCGGNEATAASGKQKQEESDLPLFLFFPGGGGSCQNPPRALPPSLFAGNPPPRPPMSLSAWQAGGGGTGGQGGRGPAPRGPSRTPLRGLAWGIGSHTRRPSCREAASGKCAPAPGPGEVKAAAQFEYGGSSQDSAPARPGGASGPGRRGGLRGRWEQLLGGLWDLGGRGARQAQGLGAPVTARGLGRSPGIGVTARGHVRPQLRGSCAARPG